MEQFDPEMITSALHLRANNDRNGNPRRIFVGFNGHGHVLITTDEGYAGRPQWLRDLNDRGVWETSIDVPVSEWRRFRHHPYHVAQ